MSPLLKTVIWFRAIASLLFILSRLIFLVALSLYWSSPFVYERIRLGLFLFSLVILRVAVLFLILPLSSPILVLLSPLSSPILVLPSPLSSPILILLIVFVWSSLLVRPLSRLPWFVSIGILLFVLVAVVVVVFSEAAAFIRIAAVSVLIFGFSLRLPISTIISFVSRTVATLLILIFGLSLVRKIASLIIVFIILLITELCSCFFVFKLTVDTLVIFSFKFFVCRLLETGLRKALIFFNKLVSLFVILWFL